MERALNQWLPREMALLGLFEFGLSFIVIFTLLSHGGTQLLRDSPDLTRDCLVLAGMLAVTIAGTAATIGLYRPEVCLDRRRVLLTGTVTALLAFPGLLAVSGAFQVTLSFAHVGWLARLLVIWLPFMLLIRLGLGLLTSRFAVIRRVAISGAGPRAVSLHRRLAVRRHGLFQPIPRDPDADLDNALSKDAPRDQRLWGVVIAAEEITPELTGTLLRAKMRGVPVFDDRAFQEQHLGRIALESIDARWLLSADGFRDGAMSRGLKRFRDIVFSLILVVVTLPLMLLTALMVRLDSPGPIFYRQVRTGLGGKSFTLFKFRSMAVDAEVGGKPQWAQKRDPRITRVGALIRASRIDELPQLFNVLRGEMSLIGPRPERPVFVEELGRTIPFYHLRDSVKPGLTGWAQINYPYGASVEDAREKLAYDLYYVKNRGFVLDMLILLSTVRVILFREGAR